MTSVLITGANGFVGEALTRKFAVNSPYSVLGIGRQDYDLCDLTALGNLRINLGEPDIIVHTAAKANSVEFKNAGEVLANNILGTQNLIQTFPNSFHIFFSSVVVYDRPGSFCRTSNKTRPHSVYGVSKLACENLYYAAKKIAGTKSLMVRSCAVVGPSLTHGLIKAITDKIQQNPNEIELFGKNPGSIKPYIHIDDVYGYVKFVVDNQVTDRWYSGITEVNLCPNDNLSVAQVADILFKKYGVSPKINWRKDMVWKGDNARIRCQGTWNYNMLYTTSEKAVKNFDVEKF